MFNEESGGEGMRGCGAKKNVCVILMTITCALGEHAGRKVLVVEGR